MDSFTITFDDVDPDLAEAIINPKPIFGYPSDLHGLWVTIYECEDDDTVPLVVREHRNIDHATYALSHRPRNGHWSSRMMPFPKFLHDGVKGILRD
jgi:hypothetical protein